MEKTEQDTESSNYAMEDFYHKFFDVEERSIKKVSLDNLRELKEKGISTEQFLDYLCRNHGFLLHGSIKEIKDDVLKSGQKKIFASNKSAIAIMRSLYSNQDVNLGYPYFINEENPLELEIHTLPDGKFISTDRGFIYIVNTDGFKNSPEGSWQFINEKDEIEFRFIVEIEKNDFTYPVKISRDFNSGKQ